jgi:parallel beta-helix repeat protein
MAGLLAYDCRELAISNCNASYSSGWGFLLNRTHDSVFEDNYADYCCRWEPRPALGERRGHLGADAAGFLLIGSHRNAFRRNLARLGGDGFFLAGLSPEWELMGCDDNLFEDNDVSHSPNNGFEATFTRGNVFRRNTASACNYGFWLGFSRQCVLEENQIHLNRRAGVGVENGIEMQVKNCAFNENQHGILLWSKRLPDVEQSVPENDTSRDWLVEGNSFRANWTAIRIAANQDHGVRPLPASGEWGLAAPAPCRHSLSTNIFEQNRLGIELEGALETGMAENRFEDNDEDVSEL